MANKRSSKKVADVFGKAIFNYYHFQDETPITVHSPDFDDDIIPVTHLFRNYNDMPEIEQKALDLCTGNVLDVGCGAGSHALYLQQEKELNVTAIDISEGAIEICKKRGIKNAEVADFFKLKNNKFDTVLMLMNGSGIIGNLENLPAFFNQLKNLLHPGGKLLIDSSDLRYLFDEDEDGGIWIDAEAPYYGQMEYQISYKQTTSEKFPWLYLDFKLLKEAANQNNFACDLLKEGENYNYLAEITFN